MIEARDTGSPETAREGGGRDFWPDDKPARKVPNRKLLFGGGGAAAVVVIAIAAALVLTGGGDDKAPKGPVLPTAFTPDFSGEGFTKIASRGVDPRPVTEAEALAGDAKTLSSGKYTFKLAASNLATDCKSVTWGARLQGDLAKYGCSQILRGAYVSTDKKYVGQFMIINLSGEQGVQQIQRDLDRATGAGWVKPLNPPGVPPFGTGFSAAYAKTYGHYAVITWVERAGGVQPASLNEMIDVSLVIEKPADFVWGRLDLVSGGKRR
ncbi:hypothetical protein [Actinomadura rubrisoli]|uniref:Uncharacterized protein n=1 Tax=Actinomadura rubrisoli TaxID=2530368 RepID=A0A4V2YRZ6_9ACTN|nr:hypothetical protein [Actinomadura rubrisoli]TDD67157.1 hypothetical protein E1298_39615 [Actinomadura rubrisoli]